MKKTHGFLLLLVCLLMFSCAQEAPNLHNCFSIVKHTDEPFEIVNTGYGIKTPQSWVCDEDTTMVSYQIFWADRRDNHINIIYKGERYREDKSSENGILSKTAYSVIGTIVMEDGRTYNHYVFDVTEEYILSLQKVDSFDE